MAIRQAWQAGILIAAFAGSALSAQEAAPVVGDSLAPALGTPAAEGDSAPVIAAETPEGTTAATASEITSETATTDAPATGAVDTTAPVPEAVLPVEGATADGAAAAPAPAAIPAAEPELTGFAGAYARTMEFLITGGPSIWAIAALSVATVALILWKVWRLMLAGAWSRRMSARAAEAWENGEAAVALSLVEGRKGLRSRLTRAAMQARLGLSEEAAREETSRVARRLLASQGSALRALELISTIAPLLGLLGTVMGMISAFQALQEAGSRADPSMLAGGIWEALLTTAAGMAVAIPASAALTWFEAVLDNLRADLEDLAARIFVADLPGEGLGENVTKLAAQ